MNEMDWDWGCDHCRMDGILDDLGICPKCGAQYSDDDDIGHFNTLGCV
jgi:hypothetical protein